MSIKPFATEAGHWYDAKTGEPRYTIIGKNGKERNTNISDARKLRLVPSVTTVIDIMNKPGLRQYFDRQMWEAATSTPRPVGMTDDAYFLECQKWAKEHSMLARNAGTKLHGEMERHILGKTVEPEYFQHVNRVEIELEKIGVDLKYGHAEKSFAHTLGYGGKVDFHNSTTVVDFKTKPVIDAGKKLAWDEHAMQLAAYAIGLGIFTPRCINVFIGVKDSGVHIHEWTISEIKRGWEMFRHCLELWKLAHEYDPCKQEKSIEETLEEAGL